MRHPTVKHQKVSQPKLHLWRRVRFWWAAMLLAIPRRTVHGRRSCSVKTGRTLRTHRYRTAIRWRGDSQVIAVQLMHTWRLPSKGRRRWRCKSRQSHRRCMERPLHWRRVRTWCRQRMFLHLQRRYYNSLSIMISGFTLKILCVIFTDFCTRVFCVTRFFFKPNQLIMSSVNECEKKRKRR